jgi:hypothetical protein
MSVRLNEESHIGVRRDETVSRPSPLETRLRSYLKAFPVEQVDRFLLSLKGILLGSAPGTAEKRLRELNRARTTARALKTMTVETLSPEFSQPLIDMAVASIVDTGGLEQFKEEMHSSPWGKNWPPLFLVWTEMMPHLNSFISELEAEIKRTTPKRRGRRGAGNNRVLMQTGAVYAHIFGELPTSTEGGPFYNIAVQILKQKNVQRPVQAVVASLKKSANGRN